jgi:DNA-binding transcriptional ArsR family regulator
VEKISVDSYVFDTLMPDLIGHDRRPAAFIVFLFLWRKTKSAGRPTVQSISMIASETGLSKSSVQNALRWLRHRGLIDVKRKSPTATPVFTLVCRWRNRAA